jgi:hypothetical protein
MTSFEELAWLQLLLDGGAACSTMWGANECSRLERWHGVLK